MKKGMKNVQATALLAVAIAATLLSVGPVAAQRLQGGVRVDDKYNRGDGGGLSRSDLGNGNNDPFAQGNNSGPPAQEALAPASFGFDTLGAPPVSEAQKAFDLNAQDQGGGNFQGQAMPGLQDALPQQAPPQQQIALQQPQQLLNPADPDSTPEMKIAWDEWHKRVASAIYSRFTTMANKLFPRSQLAASAAYTVTKDGRVTNIHMLQKNWNPVFNAMIIGAIGALDGQAQFLAFPPGSKRMTVEKSGTFTQNYGQSGFRYTTNDQERIRQQHR